MSGVAQMLEAREEAAAEWCVRLAEGPLTHDEQQAFDSWLSSDPNRAALEEALAIWEGAEIAANLPELIHLRSEALNAFRRAHRRRWSARFGGVWAVGAAAALLVLLSVAALLLGSKAEVYETGIGERQVAMLEDGSRLSLDAASQVEKRYSAERREIRLVSGRAKFDVARDPLRPFSVVAGDRTIVATGTSFSVEFVDGGVRVILYEGHVELLDRTGNGPARPLRMAGPGLMPGASGLTPGRELVVRAGASIATVAPTDLGRSLSWEGGQLSFDSEPLGIAVERMNRYAARPLSIGDASVGAIPVSGVFTAGDTAAFVEGLAALHGIRARDEGGRVLLSRD